MGNQGGPVPGDVLARSVEASQKVAGCLLDLVASPKKRVGEIYQRGHGGLRFDEAASGLGQSGKPLCRRESTELGRRLERCDGRSARQGCGTARSITPDLLDRDGQGFGQRWHPSRQDTTGGNVRLRPPRPAP